MFWLITIEQVGWFTSDGAAVNGASLRELGKELDSADDGWDAKEHDILCVIVQLHFRFRLNALQTDAWSILCIFLQSTSSRQ